MKNNLLKKELTIGMILLFMGVAVAPGITAYVTATTDESNLVELTVQICKPDNIKRHMVQISKQNAIEIENHFDNIRRELEQAKTIEETVEILNKAITSLSEFGLLRGMTIEEAQNLVIRTYQNTRLRDPLEKMFRTIGQNNKGNISNLFCLLAVQVTGGTPQENPLPLLRMIALLFVILSIKVDDSGWIPDYKIVHPFLFLLGVYLDLFCWYHPFRFMKTQDFVLCENISWISLGLMGKKMGEGGINEIVGFTGIKISYLLNDDTNTEAYFYLGGAVVIS